MHQLRAKTVCKSMHERQNVPHTSPSGGCQIIVLQGHTTGYAADHSLERAILGGRAKLCMLTALD